ncbi:NAD(P)-dependent oxidoreductase [Paenibacillus tengchongensis]|uniref:NAD(P)-dependent oxidoreductase n=1 Tax=Paenibacillus tengchongensis TaxID=2608684 RepID=UPI00124F1B2B|nr:NAD(P)H-binding protein [Paenibacillus tengchongensis]
MKLVVFGDSGTIGRQIIEEALRRKHEVTAVFRHPEELPLTHERLQIAAGDLLSSASVAAAAHGHEVAVSAFAPGLENAEELPAAARSLLEGLQQAGVVRLVIVGDAGTLKTDSGERLMDSVNYPQELRPLAEAHSEAYAVYAGSELDYTYISPAASIVPGRRTGMFRIGLDRLVVDENGESAISAEDLAVAVLDELEEDNFIRERFAVAY